MRPLAESVGSDFLLDADVTDEASLDAVFAAIAERWGGLDFLVHAIAFSDKNELKGQYLDTSRANFLRTLDISCFSFTDLCRRAAPLMTDGGSLLTLTYAGAERVMPHYNVMGVAKAALEASVRYLAVDLGGDNIRVNAISAGPIKTLAASRHRRFPLHPQMEPVQRAAASAMSTIEDVGGAGALSAERPGAGRHRRSASCRLRLSRRRHEGGRRARHLDAS